MQAVISLPALNALSYVLRGVEGQLKVTLSEVTEIHLLIDYNEGTKNICDAIWKPRDHLAYKTVFAEISKCNELF